MIVKPKTKEKKIFVIYTHTCTRTPGERYSTAHKSVEDDVKKVKKKENKNHKLTTSPGDDTHSAEYI